MARKKTDMKKTPHIHLMLSGLCCALTIALMPLCGFAVVTHDGTLGPSGAAPVSGTDYVVIGSWGQHIGSNLFHSFSTFDVEAGRTAWFTSIGLGGSVDNIISRVTGGSASTIDGAIRSGIADANLFFVNPAGVLFGPTANVQIDGAFHVSTADFIQLGTKGTFDVAHPAGSVLTSAPPSAFGFLSKNAAGIDLGGLIIAKKDTVTDKGRALSVVGGNISMDNGVLWAPNGRIDIASVASAGKVQMGDSGPTTGAFDRLGDVTISGGASFWVSDFINPTSNPSGTGAAGSVHIRAGRFEMQDSNTAIYAFCQANQDSGGVDIQTRDDVIIKNNAVITTESGGSGNAGNLRINAGGPVTVSGTHSVLDASAYGSGNGGDIAVTSRSLLVSKSAVIKSANAGNGTHGSIAVNANDINVDNKGQIITSGGRIAIAAKAITVSDKGMLLSLNSGKHPAKAVAIDAEELKLQGNGSIYTTTVSSGRGGDISVSARGSAVISGDGSGVYASTEPGSSGQSGNVSITSPQLTVSDTGAVVSETRGTGNAGDVYIDAADMVEVHNAGRISNNSLSTRAGGNTGDIRIETGTLRISENGLVSSESAGSGDVGNIVLNIDRLEMKKGYISSSAGPNSRAGSKGGSIAVNATESVAIAGSGVDDHGRFGEYYGIYSQTQGAANGGSIYISTPSLIVSDDGMINADSYGSGHGGAIGISVDTLGVTSGGTIVAQTRGSGDAGNIRITASESVIVGGAGVKLLDSWIYTATHGRRRRR